MSAPDAAASAVLAAAADLVAAFAGHDVDAYFDAFASDASFVFHTHPARLESRAEYEQLWRSWEADDGFRVLRCRSSHQRVQVFGSTAVFTHDVATEVRVAGAEVASEERETIVFERRDGRWLAVHEHLSPAAPAPNPT